MRCFLTIAFLLVAACGGPSPTPKPSAAQSPAVSPSARLLSPGEFRDRVIAALKQADATIGVEVIDDLALNIKRGEATSGARLTTGYDEYSQNPATLDSIVAKWVSVFLTSVSNTPVVEPADVGEALVVVLRPKAYLAIQASNGQSLSQVWRPFGGDLVQLMMLNSNTMLMVATPDLLKQAGVSEQEAWKLAERNLHGLVGPLDMGDLPDNGPFIVSAQSGLATGTLAAPGMCDATGSRYNEGRIMLVVDRNSYIEALPGADSSVERFWAFAKPHLGAGDFLSDTPLTCRGGKWVEVKPPN